MHKKQKLELTWIGKGEEPTLEPRILIEDPSKSYGDPTSQNMLIHGDNLLALKALEQDYAGKVKCIYIDPPYNTGNAFEHYDDNIEHSTWLALMKPRLELLRMLLSENGIIWISIDDQEAHYLKVMCDEVFSRSNFLADIAYERSGSAGLGQGGLFVNTSERILVYKKNTLDTNDVLGNSDLELKTMKRYNKVLVDEGSRELIEEFKSSSNNLPVKIYKHINFVMETISLKAPQERMPEIQAEFISKFKKLFRTNNVQKENEFQNSLLRKMDKKYLYTVDYTPSRGKNLNKETTLYYYNAELFAWLKDTAFIEGGKIKKTNKLTTVWKHEDIPKADLANEGSVEFPRSKKPEQLIRRLLEISTNPGDIVLDSFIGSGTTAAVANKMGRRYIGVEMGDHAYTHCKVRLDKVIDGTDQGGISKTVGWKGGGGYKFYELAPSLLAQDSFCNWVISKEFNANMLAHAVAKQEGFTYEPSQTTYWKQGYSTENDYVYTTTQYVSVELLDAMHERMQQSESLLIACTAFDSDCKNRHNNITIKKIPQILLGRCEFGRDDYDLNVVEAEDGGEDSEE